MVMDNKPVKVEDIDGRLPSRQALRAMLELPEEELARAVDQERARVMINSKHIKKKMQNMKRDNFNHPDVSIVYASVTPEMLYQFSRAMIIDGYGTMEALGKFVFPSLLDEEGNFKQELSTKYKTYIVNRFYNQWKAGLAFSMRLVLDEEKDAVMAKSRQAQRKTLDLLNKTIDKASAILSRDKLQREDIKMATQLLNALKGITLDVVDGRQALPAETKPSHSLDGTSVAAQLEGEIGE